MDWIFDIPTWEFAALTSSAFILFSWFGAIFLRPILRPLLGGRAGLNDIVGYILSLFGVFYGLLLGLLAVAAYQGYGTTQGIVAKEASALAALKEDIAAYPEPKRQNLIWILRDHTRYLVKEAWPQQRRGLIPRGGDVRMTAFQENLLRFQPSTTGEELMHAETLRQFNVYYEARRMRLQAIGTSIPSTMWYVVLFGAVINLVLIWLFDMSLLSHLFLGGILAAFVGAMVFLIADMDNPFRGAVSISAAPFEPILAELMED